MKDLLPVNALGAHGRLVELVGGVGGTGMIDNPSIPVGLDGPSSQVCGKWLRHGKFYGQFGRGTQ